jgi:hypothetical protein
VAVGGGLGSGAGDGLILVSSQPEARLRARCAMLLRSHLAPPCWFSSIEHGRRHHGTAEQRAREWQALARQGVVAGIGDMLILAPGYALWLELKSATGRQSDAQLAMQNAMAALGHGYAVVRSVEQLVDVLEQHGIPLLAGARVAALRHDGMLAVPVARKPARIAKPSAAKPTRKQLATLSRLRAQGVVI